MIDNPEDKVNKTIICYLEELQDILLELIVHFQHGSN